MKTFFVTTLGCRTNQYETEAISQQLMTIGLRPVEEGKSADLCIINTCAVTQGAESSSRNTIRSIISAHKDAYVVVTGCMVTHQKKQLLEIEGVHLLVENTGKEQICQILFPEVDPPLFAVQKFSGHTRAFVKIQDGCNHCCSYCIIPQLRGTSRSRSFEDIYQEVEKLCESGHKEIVLTGVNVGDFQNEEKDLGDLVACLDAVPGIERLRISSINPNEISKKLIDAIITGKKTCPSLHLVLQSGSSSVLSRMGREYDAALYKKLVQTFRSHRNDFTFTTDVIVGFPGETEEDFEQTCSLVEECLLYKVHVFPFSKRPKTKAFYLEDQIAPKVIRERVQKLTLLSKKTAAAHLSQFIGKTLPILTEKGSCSGQTVHGIPVLLEENLLPNQIIPVQIMDICETMLIGKMIV